MGANQLPEHSPRHIVFGINNLPDLFVPGPETAFRTEQLVNPHSIKMFVIARWQLVPAIVVIVMPLHEGLIIVMPETMPVFDDRNPFSS